MSTLMSTETELQTWANGKAGLYDEFRALMEEEDRISSDQHVPRGCAYVSHPAPGRFGGWPNMPIESLQVRFELLATKAGIALGARPGTSPDEFWLLCLFLDLHANSSRLIRFSTASGGFIDSVVEASVICCARLDRQCLAMSYQSDRLEWRAANQREKIKDGAAIETSGDERIQKRSEKRNAVVMPILRSKGWKRGTWAIKAGVGKNSAYDYLSGKRKLSIENRQALAEELELKPEELPD
jgi:hypothetical protein